MSYIHILKEWKFKMFFFLLFPMSGYERKKCMVIIILFTNVCNALFCCCVQHKFSYHFLLSDFFFVLLCEKTQKRYRGWLMLHIFDLQLFWLLIFYSRDFVCSLCSTRCLACVSFKFAKCCLSNKNKMKNTQNQLWFCSHI